MSNNSPTSLPRGKDKPGRLFIVSAPSGTGKTTLVEMLVERHPSVVENISCTTRPPRSSETPGQHYHFLDRAHFEERIKNDDFLEYVELLGNYYGTSKSEVEKYQKEGKDVILVIDVQGAMLLKGKVKASFIFISPPSLEELENRLYSRKTETEDRIQRRLAQAEREISFTKHYDYHIVNHDLDRSYDILTAILVAEKHRISR